MKVFTGRNTPEVIDALKAGEIGVLLTDTIYGIVASASRSTAVEQVYEIRHRQAAKPSIVLIADTSQIWEQEQVERHRLALEAHWPGPVSIVLQATHETPEYLHRGTQTLAYRMPADEELRAMLASTGPIIAPSANLEGQPPAENIAEAKAYFGEGVDFYVDSGQAKNHQPSRVVKIEEDGTETVLR
jgi:L-threonylcarbamoyladenylate synthase